MIKKEIVIIGDIQSVKQYFNDLLNPYCIVEKMEKNKLYKMNIPTDQIDETISHDKNKDEGYETVSINGIYFYFEKYDENVELKSQRWIIQDQNPYAKQDVIEKNHNEMKNLLRS